MLFATLILQHISLNCWVLMLPVEYRLKGIISMNYSLIGLFASFHSWAYIRSVILALYTFSVFVPWNKAAFLFYVCFFSFFWLPAGCLFLLLSFQCSICKDNTSSWHHFGHCQTLLWCFIAADLLSVKIRLRTLHIEPSCFAILCFVSFLLISAAVIHVQQQCELCIKLLWLNSFFFGYYFCIVLIFLSFLLHSVAFILSMYNTHYYQFHLWLFLECVRVVKVV